MRLIRDRGGVCEGVGGGGGGGVEAEEQVNIIIARPRAQTRKDQTDRQPPPEQQR